MKMVTNTDLDLLCPKCSSSYLTHDAVHVFNRKRNSKYGQHVTVYYGDIHQDTYMTDNPSPKRSGVRLKFRCEECTTWFYLVLSEHEEGTKIFWEKAEKQYAHYRRIRGYED